MLKTFRCSFVMLWAGLQERRERSNMRKPESHDGLFILGRVMTSCSSSAVASCPAELPPTCKRCLVADDQPSSLVDAGGHRLTVPGGQAAQVNYLAADAGLAGRQTCGLLQHLSLGTLGRRQSVKPRLPMCCLVGGVVVYRCVHSLICHNAQGENSTVHNTSSWKQASSQ